MHSTRSSRSSPERLHAVVRPSSGNALRLPPFLVMCNVYDVCRVCRKQQRRMLYSTAVNMKLLMDMPEMVTALSQLSCSIIIINIRIM